VTAALLGKVLPDGGLRLLRLRHPGFGPTLLPPSLDLALVAPLPRRTHELNIRHVVGLSYSVSSTTLPLRLSCPAAGARSCAPVCRVRRAIHDALGG
jgi:hypothetical protein